MKGLLVHIVLRLVMTACFTVTMTLQAATHGVIREYAALAPTPEAVPLPALFDAPLTDISITLGPDHAFYLTGSKVDGQKAVFTDSVQIWRSPDMKRWDLLRTVGVGPAKVASPELHFLGGSFWMTLGYAGGGTGLVHFDGNDLATCTFQQTRITAQGETPSLFRDDDGTYFWLMDTSSIARMQKDPMAGLVGTPKVIPLSREQDDKQAKDRTIVQPRGPFLAKIQGKYHLFITGRVMVHGLGRTGVPEGVDDVLVAASEKPDGDYSPFYVGFPNAGQTTLFRDGGDALWATYSGMGERAILRGRPAAFRVEQVPAQAPAWPIGFSGTDQPDQFPFQLMLRPDTAFIYEGGMGTARCATLDLAPGQKMAVPWIRDVYIMVGHDGNYYLTGTSGNMDGINLWRSADLKHFTFVKQVWTPSEDRKAWYNSSPSRLIWAPELHYVNGTYWIPFCISLGREGKNSLLRSTSGKPEGPYEQALAGNHGVDDRIDSSLFHDDDGKSYYVWQNGLIRRLNAAMSDFDGKEWKIIPSDGKQVGYEGATVVKIGQWYVLTCAEWNGGGNRSDGTYDMMYSCTKNLINGPWKPRRVAVPHAGHGVLFQDKAGAWLASFFGNDRTAPFRAMPGYVQVDTRDTGDDLLIVPKASP